MSNTKSAKPEQQGKFAHRLLDWYERHARKMPWRVPPKEHAVGVRGDPYKIWLSEVMLQQTQVATVVEYFEKFVRKWPTVNNLAASDLDDVLKAWAGLGYYSRARNLKKCADQIVEDHGGRFPERAESLVKLPGIGDYTSAAIAAIAFDEAIPVLDGNVERVLARHRRITATFPGAKTEAKALLSTLLDPQKPGEFAQAMMDLGATICTPKRPACSLCPVNQDCKGFANGDAELFPAKASKAKKPTRRGAAFVMLNSQDEVFLCKRPETGLLASMTQVPTTDWTARQDGATGANAAPAKADWKLAGIAKHTFTHFHLELETWVAQIDFEPPMDGWWCQKRDLQEQALPKVMHRVLGLLT